MSNNAEKKSETSANNVLPKKNIWKRYRNVRKAIINTFDPIRQDWISEKIEDQDKYNAWSERWTLCHNRELKRLKNELADVKSENQSIREDLDAIKGMLPNFFPAPEKEDVEESQVVEPNEKIETVLSESSQEEPSVVDESEKENPVLEDPKEKKRGFFAKLLKKITTKAVEKDEVSVPSGEKRGFFARFLKKKPTE